MRRQVRPFLEATTAVVFAALWNEPTGPPGPSSGLSWRPPGPTTHVDHFTTCVFDKVRLITKSPIFSNT